MGAGLIIVNFGYVREGHTFRYQKRYWLKDGPFTYTNIDESMRRRFRMKMTQQIAAKPENCHDYHGQKL